MTRINKLGMFAGASVAALGLALAAAPATAADEVNWEWNAEINTDVNLEWENENIDVDPSNLAMIEDLQVHIGDVSAESTVQNVWNNQPTEGFDPSGTVEIPVDWETTGKRGGHPSIAAYTNLTFGEDIKILDEDGNELKGADLDEWLLDCSSRHGSRCDGEGKFTIVAEVDGEFIEIDSFDAVDELPEVVSAATAVANNASVDAEFDEAGGGALLLHEGQFVFNVGSGQIPHWYGDGQLDALQNPDESGNTNLALTEFGINAAIAGILEHSDIEADSEVGNIHNATVDSAATAVANNFSGDMMSDEEGVLIGDITQFSMANVSADSDVRGVHINNYTNLGEDLGRPIVDSVATAVGNNKSISVNVGGVFD